MLVGNLEAKRDWGYAPEYVEAMWLMLQQDTPQDYVIATGEQHSVRHFIAIAAEKIGINLNWKGSAQNEVGRDDDGRSIVRVDSRYFRPAEVEALLGDSTKAREKLGWKPKISLCCCKANSNHYLP